MKGFQLVAATGLIGGVLALLSFAAAVSQTKAQVATAESQRRPVIVELFTSEGCSSCPPADALLHKLQAEQSIKGAEVIALEEHVDYWNHDGWTDPYSSSEWTERQLDYEAPLKISQSYTPEMVVDGEAAFVGSDERKAESEIEKASRDAKTKVTITPATPDTKQSQNFAVSVGTPQESTAGDAAEVWLAVAEDGLQSSVSRGENAGQVLLHTATLRSLQKLGVVDPNHKPTAFTGSANVKFEPHWNREKLHVTVFVQEKKNRKILGAATTKITR
jgi:hypothetical protein